jgi:hypothetical protein
MPRQRDPQICCSSRCLRQIQPWEPAVEVRCFARTHGMGTRRTSKSESMFLCPQCATRTAILEKPPGRTEPFHLAIFKILLDLVGGKADVVEAVYEQVKERRSEILYPTALPEGEILAPEKRQLKAAS